MGKFKTKQEYNAETVGVAGTVTAFRLVPRRNGRAWELHELTIEDGEVISDTRLFGPEVFNVVMAQTEQLIRHRAGTGKLS